MARLTPQQWSRIRLQYETTEISIEALGKAWGVGEASIYRHMRKDGGWRKDPGMLVERATQVAIGKSEKAQDHIDQIKSQMNVIARGKTHNKTRKEVNPDKTKGEITSNPVYAEILPSVDEVRAAVEREAKKRALIIDIHREEWVPIWDLVDQAIQSLDFNAAMFVKTIIQAIALKQEAERKAWGIDIKRIEISGPEGGSVQVEQIIKPDLNRFTSEQLFRLREIANEVRQNRSE